MRRAYKRSALQLHPDKALTQCRFSSRLGIHGALLVDTAQVCALHQLQRSVYDIISIICFSFMTRVVQGFIVNFV